MSKNSSSKKQFAFPLKLEGKDIRICRQRLGMTQAEFAHYANVSIKTVERWESGFQPISGPVVPLVSILTEQPQLIEAFTIPEKEYPMRLWYYFKKQLCTLIDVDERRKKIKIHNYTDDDILRAFGIKEKPDFDDYKAFLESRCFPASRDKMKLMLEHLGIPYYDPLLIIERTQGRMAEDDFWIKIEK